MMNLRRIALLAAPVALVLALAGGARLGAQAPQSTQATQAAPAGQNAQPAPSAEAGKPGEPAAAGEPAEEGHAAHHHPVVILFGHSLDALAQFGVTVFNFVLFAGILVVLLKGALASAFKARGKELADKLSQAEREKAEAERQIRELEARMAGLQQELEGIMAKAGADAEAEKARILESARAEAAQIRLQTQADIQAQQRSAENGLRDLVAELVVTGAAQRLEARLRGDVAARALDQAIERVGGSK